MCLEERRGRQEEISVVRENVSKCYFNMFDFSFLSDSEAESWAGRTLWVQVMSAEPCVDRASGCSAFKLNNGGSFHHFLHSLTCEAAPALPTNEFSPHHCYYEWSNLCHMVSTDCFRSMAAGVSCEFQPWLLELWTPGVCSMAFCAPFCLIPWGALYGRYHLTSPVMTKSGIHTNHWARASSVSTPYSKDNCDWRCF